MRRFGIICAAMLVAATSAAAAEGDAARGEKRFEDCASCHAVAADQNGVGPSLHGIFGRKAASLDDFRYSPAMQRSGLTWDDANLHAYIKDPQAKVKGNRMPFGGLSSEADIDDVIAYLKDYK